MVRYMLQNPRLLFLVQSIYKVLWNSRERKSFKVSALFPPTRLSFHSGPLPSALFPHVRIVSQSRKLTRNSILYTPTSLLEVGLAQWRQQYATPHGLSNIRSRNPAAIKRERFPSSINLNNILNSRERR